MYVISKHKFFLYLTINQKYWILSFKWMEANNKSYCSLKHYKILTDQAVFDHKNLNTNSYECFEAATIKSVVYFMP